MLNRPMLTVFAAGELSPLLAGRIDLPAYYKGCSQLENFIPMKQGGVTRRPGTIFVTSAYSASGSAQGVDHIARFIPFVVSEVMGYVWEMTNEVYASGYMARAFYDHQSIWTMTLPDPFDLDCQYLQIKNVMYFAHPDQPVYKMTYTSASAWTISTAVFTASTAGENFSSATHYPRALGFFDDRLLLSGTDENQHKTWGSVTGSHEDFTQGATPDDAFEYGIGQRSKQIIQWIEGGEELEIGTSEGEGVMFGTEEGITPATTVWWRWIGSKGSAYIQPLSIDKGIVFIDDSRRKVFEIDSENGWSTMELTSYADHISGDGVGETPPLPSWAHFAGEAGGFCRGVMYQKDPHPMLWFPTKGGELAGCAFDKELFAWTRLKTGAISSVATAHANYYGDAFFRSIAVIPNTDGQSEMWAQVTRWDTDRYRNYIEYFASNVWEDDEDGHWVDSGVDTKASEAYYFTSLAVTTSLSITIFNSVAAVVSGDFLRFSDISNSLYPTLSVLNGNSYEVTAPGGYVISMDTTGMSAAGDADLGIGLFRKVVGTVSSLAHLEGALVHITRDGINASTATVSGGTVSLPAYGNHMHVGLPYTPKLRTMNLEAGGPRGVMQGAEGKITDVMLRFHKTMDARVGYSEDDTLDDVEFDSSTALLTGDYNITFPGGYQDEKYIYVDSNKPTAITVLGLIPNIYSYSKG